MGEIVSLEVKMIGKPYVGELHVRFDEGGTGTLAMEDPKRARSWKQRIQPRCGLKQAEPVIYSTHIRLSSITKSFQAGTNRRPGKAPD